MDIKGIDSVFALLIGTNGTGKSTLQRKILEAARPHKKVLVVPSHSAEPTFKDLKTIKASDIKSFNKYDAGAAKVMCYEEKDFLEVAPQVRNTVLMSDDFRNYLPNGRTPAAVRRAFIERRHHRNDIYMACHGFTHVPPEFLQFANVIILFKTVDNPLRHRDKFLHPKEMLEAVERVNKKAMKDKYYHEVIINQ